MNAPLESDWKKFRALFPVWRERRLAETNRRIAAELAQAGKTETERFWAADKLLGEEAQILVRCFDDIRRSRLSERLLEMRGAGVIRREDLSEFSPELQENVFFDFPAENPEGIETDPK